MIKCTGLAPWEFGFPFPDSIPSPILKRTQRKESNFVEFDEEAGKVLCPVSYVGCEKTSKNVKTRNNKKNRRLQILQFLQIGQSRQSKKANLREFDEEAEEVLCPVYLPPARGRCKATWKREFEIPWCEAGPPNHQNDKVGSGQYVVNK